MRSIDRALLFFFFFNRLNEEFIPLLDISSNGDESTVHNYGEGRAPGGRACCQLPAGLGNAANNAAAISMEVTLLAAWS